MFPAVFRSYRRYKNHSYVKINLRKYRFFQFHFPGNAGDSLSYDNSSPFSTKDRDNDGWNCARTYKAGWWYGRCNHSNLNGLYRRGGHSSSGDGVIWFYAGEVYLYYYFVKRAEMKLKPVNF